MGVPLGSSLVDGLTSLIGATYWSLPPKAHGTMTSTSPLSSSSTHQPASCPTVPHARHRVMATPSISAVSQVSSPPLSNGLTSPASPSLSARRCGAPAHLPLASSVLLKMASPHAWVIPADH